jgi:hypothetical protein
MHEGIKQKNPISAPAEQGLVDEHPKPDHEIIRHRPQIKQETC